MKLKKNKKSLAFFAFLPIFLIITFFVLTFTMQGSANDAIDLVKGYHTQLIGIDKFNQIKVIENFYNTEQLNRFKSKIEKSFSNLNYLSSDDLSSRIDNNCRINKMNLFYDERKIEPKNDKCLPKISKDSIKKDLENLIKKEADNSFNIGTSTNTQIITNEKSNSFKIRINRDLSSKDKNGIISNNKDFIEKQINLDSFTQLILAIKTVLPKFSKSNKKEIPKCLIQNLKNKNNKNKNSNDEISCLEKNFINLIKTQNPTIIENYDFKLSSIEKSNIENFFSLKLDVYKKDSKDNVLNFAMIIKYNIPQNLVSFNLEQYNDAQNFINLKINKPKVNLNKIEGYIVLYSYENFFSNSFKGFNELKNILDTGEVPKKIKQVTLTRPANVDKLNLGVRYHLFENPNLNLNLINIPNDKIFTKNPITNKEEKSIFIFQSYNYQTKKFEKIKSNQKIYAYVFAYDKSYSYYVDAINPNIIKSIELKSTNGPKPLFFSTPPINWGDIPNLDQSINIKIPKNLYSDKQFDHYDIYLLKGDKIQLNKNNYGCQNVVDFKCEYFSGLEYQLDKKEMDLILTSKNNIENPENKMIINTQKIQLINDNKYSILIVPNNKNNKGLLKSIYITYKTNPENAEFYAIGTGEGMRSPQMIKDIVIKDNMAPNPLTSFQIDPNNPIKISSGYYVLQWGPTKTATQTENVKYLKADVETYDLATGKLISSNSKTIQRDGIIIVKNENIGKIIVKNIIPVDQNLNKVDNNTYDMQQTQSATFNI